MLAKNLARPQVTTLIADDLQLMAQKHPPGLNPTHPSYALSTVHYPLLFFSPQPQHNDNTFTRKIYKIYP